MSNPNAAAYIVEGIADATEGSGFRWAFAHPVVRFLVPRMEHPRFVMDFALPERTFRQTGPVTLSFAINGQPLDRARFDHAGQQHFERDVPLALLHFDSVNLVSIQPDRVWTSPEDGAKLSFVIARLGFVE